MRLTENDLVQFSAILASDAPAPGGGSVAALDGALGIALTNMVAALSQGKEKYKEFEDLINPAAEKAADLRIKFLDAINRDTEIFAQMSAVFEMPRATDEEKEVRKVAMQDALKACTVVPYEIMEFCAEALQVTDSIVGKSNKSASSDLGVAALNLKAAIQAAWLNVLINIGGIKDEAFVNGYKEKGEALLAEALPLADSIYERVKSSL